MNLKNLFVTLVALFLMAPACFGVPDSVCEKNGRLLAITGSYDGIARIWDVKAKECVGVLEGHAKGSCGCINSSSFSRDGRQAITASYDKTVKIWDLETCKCTKTLVGHLQAVNSAFLSPDNTCAITASSDGTVKIWDTETCKCVKTLKRGSSGSFQLKPFFSPNTTMVATVDGVIARIWDISDIKNVYEKQTLHCGYYILAVSFSPCGKKVIIGTCGSAKIWNFETEDLTGDLLHWDQGSVDSASFSTDGKHAIITIDDFAKVWDLERGCFVGSLVGHKNIIEFGTFSQDGKYAITASSDKTAKIWDTSKLWDDSTYECIATIEHEEWVGSADLCFSSVESGMREDILELSDFDL